MLRDCRLARASSSLARHTGSSVEIRTSSSPDDLKLKAANVRVLVIHQAEEAAKGLERIQRALEGELPNIADGIMNLTQFTRTFLAPSFGP